MTNKRRESARKKRDEHGNVVCSCGCGRPPGKGRRTWHSQECVDRWMTANSSQYVRNKLFERDKGVCAMCGVNSIRAESRARLAKSTSKWYVRFDPVWGWQNRNGWSKPIPEWFMSKWSRVRQRLNARVEKMRLKRIDAMKSEGWDVHRHMSWWEADHIIPVAEGGGQCGIENYRTLCVRCHRKVTRELRARLAAKRKATK